MMVALPDELEESQRVPPEGAEAMREFYLSTGHWRAVLWALGGCALILAVGITVNRFLGIPVDPGGIAFVVAFFTIGTIYLGSLLRPRLRIDGNGISRAVLWWWDLWPWEAFREGRIIPDGQLRGIYRFPERGALFERLNLAYLEEGDADAIRQLIGRIWKPPARPPLPEALTLRRFWPNSGCIEMTCSHLVVRCSGRESDYRWRDVRSVEIWRVEHGNTDFRELQITLPDRELNLLGNEGDAVTRQQLCVFLARQLDPSLCHEIAISGTPRTAREVDARLRRIEDSRKGLVQVRWMILCLFFLTPLLFIPFWGWIKSFALLGCYLPVMYATYWMVSDRFKRADQEIGELRAWHCESPELKAD